MTDKRASWPFSHLTIWLFIISSGSGSIVIASLLWAGEEAKVESLLSSGVCQRALQTEARMSRSETSRLKLNWDIKWAIKEGKVKSWYFSLGMQQASASHCSCLLPVACCLLLSFGLHLTLPSLGQVKLFACLPAHFACFDGDWRDFHFSLK